MNTEIRIGNIVGTYEPHRVNGIYLSHFTAVNKNGVEHNSVQYNLSPIPLTPEILEKAGWFVIEKDKKYINNERGVITVSFDELGMVMYKIGDMNFTTVHNVHQLQNLYFALTGEELKIEL